MAGSLCQPGFATFSKKGLQKTDVKKPDLGWKNYPHDKNITFLPTMDAPERMIYNMLYDMDETDEFWDNSLSGYSKAVCFRDYPNRIDNIDCIKKWLTGQK